jgi:hypothetical protein
LGRTVKSIRVGGGRTDDCAAAVLVILPAKFERLDLRHVEDLRNRVELSGRGSDLHDASSTADHLATCAGDRVNRRIDIRAAFDPHAVQASGASGTKQRRVDLEGRLEDADPRNRIELRNLVGRFRCHSNLEGEIRYVVEELGASRRCLRLPRIHHRTGRLHDEISALSGGVAANREPRRHVRLAASRRERRRFRRMGAADGGPCCAETTRLTLAATAAAAMCTPRPFGMRTP